MSHADPFSGIAAFITAAQCESFSQAGRKLAQTPSAISKSISRLEENLSVKLFNRSPRLITLTPEGEVFYQQCKELLTTVQDARAVVTGQQLEGSGHLRVCLPISVGNKVVAPALPAWLKANPKITLDIEFSDRHVDLIQERFDLAIRFHNVPDSRLVAIKLPNPVFVTAASQLYWETHGLPLHPNDLNQHCCLAYQDSVTQTVRRWEFKDDNGTYKITPKGQLAADQGAFLLSMAIQDQGVIHAPKYLLTEALGKGHLIEVLTNYQTTGPDWYLVYPYRRQPSLKLQSFILFLKSVLL